MKRKFSVWSTQRRVRNSMVPSSVRSATSCSGVQSGLCLFPHRADRAGYCPCLPSTFLPFSFHYGSLCYARCYIYVFEEPLRITLGTGLWAVYQRTDVLELCESLGRGDIESPGMLLLTLVLSISTSPIQSHSCVC